MQFLSHRMQFLGRLLGGLMLSVAVFSLSGCMTQALLNSDVNYKEKISSILVTEDGKKMLIIGQDYHYIFNVNPQILSTIKADYRTQVTASIDRFFVANDQTTTGRIHLSLNKDASPEFAQAAAAAGYHCSENLGCKVSPYIRGVRYKAKALPLGVTEKLKKEYVVDVTYHGSPGAKVLLTPVTVVADGVVGAGALLLGGVAAIGWTALVVGHEVCGSAC